MAVLFVSYSHKDEALRDRLGAHLMSLEHRGLIETWHDRRLLAGEAFGDEINKHLERADIILLLVSSDFIASRYCYSVEMKKALARHNAGEARVIPVILRECHWHPLPFGHITATPRDGIAVKSWPDEDKAFTDIVRAIEDALSKGPAAAASAMPSRRASSPTATASMPRSSNLKLRKTFTEADRDRFLEDAFSYIAQFFENSLDDLQHGNPGIECSFRQIDANQFTAVIYRNGNTQARCRIALSNMMGRGITYSSGRSVSDNSINDQLSVEVDGEGMYLKGLAMMIHSGNHEPRMTHESAAEYYWSQLILPLQHR